MRPVASGHTVLMIEIEGIEQWRGKEVVDVDGDKLGKLDEVYFDPASGQPLVAAVKSGLLGRNSTLVPLEGATAGRDHVRIPRRKADLSDAPSSPGADLAAGDVHAVENFYGVQLAVGTGTEAVALEGSVARDERRAAARDAQERADALDAHAEEKSAGAQEAQARADAAAAEAQRADAARTEAVAEADAARRPPEG